MNHIFINVTPGREAEVVHLHCHPERWLMPGSQSKCPAGAVPSLKLLPTPFAGALSMAPSQKHQVDCL